MPKPGNTTTTLLLRSLKDASNAEVWSLFDSRYRPILTGFARSFGLGEDDASDVAQHTLARFAAEYKDGGYQRGRGRLSSYLIAIAHHRIADLFRQKNRNRIERGASAMHELPASPGDQRLASAWEAQQQASIFAAALEELRTNTRLSESSLRAFELTALRNTPPEEAALQCGISVSDVYVAKNRVTKRLREIVAELTSAYAEQET